MAPITATPDAIQQVFNWFNANGGPNRTAGFASNPTIPGLTPQIHGSLDSPYNLEYAGGVSRQFGSRAAIRADVAYRKFYKVYVTRIDTTTGKVTNSFGQQFDLAYIENDNDGLLHRQYSGLTVSGHVSVQAARGSRRQLHAVAHLGQLRGRERRQRPDDERRLLVSRVQAGVLELSRTAICRSISGTVRGCG